MRLKPEKMCPEAVTWSDLISQYVRLPHVLVYVLTYLMWRSQKWSLKVRFLPKTMYFISEFIQKSGYLGICAYRGMIISPFLVYFERVVWWSDWSGWLWMASVFEEVKVLRWRLKPASKVKRSLSIQSKTVTLDIWDLQLYLERYIYMLYIYIYIFSFEFRWTLQVMKVSVE